MKKPSPALVQVHAAVLLFGLAGLFGKLVGLPAIPITFARVLFSSLSLLVFTLLKRQSLRMPKKLLLRLCGAGMLLAVHWCSFYQSIQLSSVAVGLLITLVFPCFTLFLEPLIFREKLRLRNVAVCALSVIGTVFVVMGNGESGGSAASILFGLLAALSYSLLTVLNRIFAKDHPAGVISLVEQGAAAVVLAPIGLYQVRSVPSVKDILLLVLLGVVFTALAHTLFTMSLRKVSALSAGLISCLEPVYGIIFAALLIREFPAPLTFLGGALILLTAVLSSLQAAKGA